MATNTNIETLEDFTAFGTVEDANKVQLSNASNTNLVYPITHVNCVQVNGTTTLDDLLKNTAFANTNSYIRGLDELIKAEASTREEKDGELSELISALDSRLNEKKINDISPASVENGVNLIQMNNGLIYVTEEDVFNVITKRLAPPLYVEDGKIKIKLGNFVNIDSAGGLTVKLSMKDLIS